MKSIQSLAPLLKIDISCKMSEPPANKNEKEAEHPKNNKIKTKKGKKRLLAETSGKHGVCYLSRIPPRMDPSNVRHMLGNFGDIGRIYLVPEGAAAQGKQHKKSGGYHRQNFSEGWVEFSKKSDARRVANMLNGEKIGGKKRSPFYHDIWNIKYLSKFKWDDLIEEKVENSHAREQKMNMELSAAKRESEHYLSKIDQSKTLDIIHERMQKRQKTEAATSNETVHEVEKRKIIRKFPQNKPVHAKDKSELSTDFLAEIFNAGS